MKTPLVTVGIPIYNAAPYLDFAIRSVVNQTFTDWELILIDDGSTDDSLAIARRWESDQIRIVFDGQNRGLPIRLNQLTKLTQGKYLARMDADDIMAPDRLRQQVVYLQSHPDTDIVASFVYTINTQNCVYGRRGNRQLPGTLSSSINSFPITHPSVMGSQAWFLKNPYNEKRRRSEDIDLWLRTMSNSQFAILDVPLLFYRELGLPYLKKYLQSNQEYRQILAEYTPLLGWQTVRLAQARFLLKDWTYRVFSALDQEDFLIKRRSQKLTAEAQQRAQALLQQSIRLPD
jgi:glycosyltransferase involved in cell wall biosynthesis